jgi:hypothetical protein
MQQIYEWHGSFASMMVEILEIFFDGVLTELKEDNIDEDKFRKDYVKWAMEDYAFLYLNNEGDYEVCP